jgi:hypothetical protein
VKLIMIVKIHIRNNFGFLCPIFIVSSGNVLCPVCSHELESAEYDLVQTLFGGTYICPECRTQLGATDVPNLNVVGTKYDQLDAWADLRLKWLIKIGWKQSMLDRLQSTLGIDTKQLRDWYDSPDEDVVED